MKKSLKVVAITGLAIGGIGLLGGGAPAPVKAEQLKLFQPGSGWECIANGSAESPQCYDVAHDFCKQKGYATADSFKFKYTPQRLGIYSRIICAR